MRPQRAQQEVETHGEEISAANRSGKDFLLGLSYFNLLVVLIHSVIPFLKFCFGQKVYLVSVTMRPVLFIA